MHTPRYSTAFVGGFSGPIGAYIAGFGALNTAALDSYWHALYGIDVMNHPVKTGGLQCPKRDVGSRHDHLGAVS